MDWTQVSCTAGGLFTVWATREALTCSNKYIKIYLHVEQFSQNTYWKLAEDLIQSKVQERSLCVQWRKKREKEESEQNLYPWEPPSLPGKCAKTHREHQRLERRECELACGPQSGERAAETVLATLLHVPAGDMHLLVCAVTRCWNVGFSRQT